MQKHTRLIRSGRNGRWLRLSWLLLLSLVIVLAGCGGGGQILVAEYDRDGLLELFLLNEGDEESEWQSLGEELEHAFVFEEGSPAFFVPDTNHILITYADNGDVVIEHLEIGDEAPNEIFEGDRASLFGSYSTDPFAVFLRERRDSDDMRCYVSLDGAEADRMARATNCFTTESGVISIDRNDEETTLTVMDLDGDNETVLLDDVEDVDQIRWNADLSRAAYTQQDGNDMQLYVIERGEEEAVAVGDEFERILSLGFLGDGETVYYLAQEDEDEERMLFLSSGEDAIAEEVIPFNIASSADGDYLAYLEESGNEVALMVQPTSGDEAVEVMEADEITFFYLDSAPARLALKMTRSCWSARPKMGKRQLNSFLKMIMN